MPKDLGIAEYYGVFSDMETGRMHGVGVVVRYFCSHNPLKGPNESHMIVIRVSLWGFGQPKPSFFFCWVRLVSQS